MVDKIAYAYETIGASHDRSDDEYNPEAVSWWGRHITKMRILLVPVMATQLMATVALGYATESFAHQLDPVKTEKPNIRFIAMLSADGVVLLVSIIAETLHCKIRKRERDCPRLVAQTPMVMTAALFGVWSASIVLNDKANDIYNNYQKNFSDWQGKYQTYYADCLEAVSSNSTLFTAQSCTRCYSGAITMGMYYDQIMQAVIQKGINMTLCGIPPHINSIESNRTIVGQEWPCGGVFTSQETTTFEEPFLAGIREQYNFNPPMVFDIYRSNESCGNLVGFATNLYNLTLLCDGTTESIFNLDNPCTTPFLIDYFTEYRSDITNIKNQEPMRPNAAISMMNSSESLDLSFSLGGMLILSILYFIFDHRSKHRQGKGEPLLIS